MSRFLKLHRVDPARRFGTVLRRSWPSMESAYIAAFGANARCTELLDEERWLAVAALPPLPFLQFSTPAVPPGDLADRREALWLSAEAEDVQADLQAGTVLLGRRRIAADSRPRPCRAGARARPADQRRPILDAVAHGHKCDSPRYPMGRRSGPALSVPVARLGAARQGKQQSPPGAPEHRGYPTRLRDWGPRTPYRSRLIPCARRRRRAARDRGSRLPALRAHPDRDGRIDCRGGRH